MAVRAKMRVTELKQGLHDKPEEPIVTVVLQPVFGGKDDEANREWSKWTPSGELRLCITNKAASDQFKLGQTFYVDMQPAEG